LPTTTGLTLAALDDLVVVDLSLMMPGQYCGMILADLGARVVKVERPGTGDFSRSALVGTFEAVNRNKRALTLDLKQPPAQEALHRLVANADVFLEGFRPGVAARLAADYETLRHVNPRLVYCSISGYGQTGPYRDRTGHDPNYLAVAGVLGLAGDPDGPPQGVVGASMADLSGAFFAAISVLAALRARDRHGIGQYIDMSLTDASYALMASRLVEYLLNGQPSKSELMSRPGIGAFETSDGRYLTVAGVEDHFWAALARLIGRAEWIDDPRFATTRERRKAGHGREIRAALSAAFRTRPRDAWLRDLETAGVPCAPVNSLAEAAEDVHARAREIVQWVAHPTLGQVPQVRFPGLLSETPATIRSRPPLLGEHTDAILAELDYSPEHIAELHARGAI
jgi:crotonobetainyl-CoA:carnitine CoA-transferase CaiB-like acyl-CoA transferase